MARGIGSYLRKMNKLLILVPVVLVLLHYITRKKYEVNKTGIVLITGASTGIGRHAAEHIASNHDYLVLAGVRKESDADSIRQLGVKNLQPIIIDVASHDSVVRAVDEIKGLVSTKSLPFVGLVNNAGVSRKVIAEFHAVDDAKAVFDTNFFGVLDLVQQTLPLLRASKGRIINISSVAGFLVVPKFGVYSASKYALEALSDAIRRETAHFGISVSVVEPAFVKSAIHQASRIASSKVVSETDEQKEMLTLYGQFLTQAKADKHSEELKTADGPIVTSVAIEDALVSSYPQTRYAVARASGLHASVIRWVAWLLSDRLADIVLME